MLRADKVKGELMILNIVFITFYNNVLYMNLINLCFIQLNLLSSALFVLFAELVAAEEFHPDTSNQMSITQHYYI